MWLLPQALQKESEFKGFRPSITAILSSAARTDPDINLPLATFWHSVAEGSNWLAWIWWKLYEPRGCDGECSSNIWEAGDQTYHLQLLKVKLVWRPFSAATFPLGKDSHVFQTIALGALLRQHGLDAKSLTETLLNWIPHAAPHPCCFCFKPCKRNLSSKDSGPASLPFCHLLLAQIRTSIFHWQRFGAAWLKVLIDWHGFLWIWWKLYEPRGCDGECSSNIWEAGDQIYHLQLPKVKLAWRPFSAATFPWVRIATSSKQ